MLAGASLGWLTEQARDAAPKEERSEAKRDTPMRIGEREQIRTVFQLASELNATLNYERVLEMALDLSAKALAEEGHEDEHLVSALLVFSNEELRVASARRDHSGHRVSPSLTASSHQARTASAAGWVMGATAAWSKYAHCSATGI